jgi:ferritin-like metal-binding protein YciE
MKNFYELFIKELKDMYYAEKQIVEALPRFIKAATSVKLKEAFHDHLKETRHQVKRLEQIARHLDENLSGGHNAGIHALIKEGSMIARFSGDHMVKDAALIGSAQKIEHYEIASYGTLKAFARHLKLVDIEELLDENAKEEGHANKRLTEIAEGTFLTSGVNKEACKRLAA